MKRKNIIMILFAVSLLIICDDVFAYNKVACGNMNNIPEKVTEITSFLVTAIQVAVPIILVVAGSLDFAKAVGANKDEDIAKGQKVFIKRIINAAIVFLIIVFAKFLIGLISDNSSESNNIGKCIDCFINGSCEQNKEV